jgi:RimJ/RimL family protein N-acetyltransferase
VATLEPRIVQTRRAGAILLRAPEEGDMPAWVAYERAQFQSDPHKVTEESEFDGSEAGQWARLREPIERPGCLVVVACPADRPREIIGDLMFQNGKMAKMAHQGHFGIAVAGPWRGKGIGGAMIGAMLDWAGASPLIEKVSLGVWAVNLGAIRMYERAGFREEGRRLAYFKLGPGRYVDDVQMSIWVKPGLAPAGFNTWGGDGARGLGS